jgi:hypothetical protein
MNSKTWKNKALSLCLVIATITTYSMVALANPNKVVGEILLTNNSSSVKVNGEATQNGRSIFTSSTIITPNNTDAVINLGKLGKVKLDSDSQMDLSFDSENFISNLSEGTVTVMNSNSTANTIVSIGQSSKVKLAPNTSVTFVFDGTNVTGQLLAGEVTALSTSRSITLTNKNGKVSKLNTGDTAKALQDDDDDDDGGSTWWIWALVFGGAAAGILIAANSDNNRIALGGGTTVVSPNR